MMVMVFNILRGLKNKYALNIFVILVGVIMFSACEKDEEVFDRTRLFRPVLNEDLYSEGNVIIVNLGNMRSAEYYTVEVSRDTFATIDYTIETDTNYVEINEDLIGEELYWNTLYQIRATAHADDPEFDSRISDLGNVRTQRFPSILNVPSRFDVIDTAARVTWTAAGAPVTGIQVYAAEDLSLNTPLFEERLVNQEERDSTEAIVTGLDPDTEYQIALYSEDQLRGWVNYTTLPMDIDPNDANVIDIRGATDSLAVSNAVASAPDGAVVLISRGSVYKFPEQNLNKSITIRATYGFGEKQAMLYTTGNWDIDDNSNIDHVRFIDLELRGEDYTGDYVFNPNRSNVNVGEVLFEKCHISNFRGIMRIRTTVQVEEFTISNSIVDTIGGYGIFTTDTNPSSDAPTASVQEINLLNSSFNYIDTGIQSRNNSQSITIDGCSFANFIVTGGRFFRYRGGDGNDNVTNGITISNSIFGHSWDTSDSDNYGIQGIGQGLGNTNFNIVNNYSTANFFFSGGEIPGFPIANYNGTQDDLWMNVATENNFNFQDRGFSGRFDTGDPRWRIEL